MAYSNCVLWNQQWDGEQNNLKGKIKMEMFLHRHKEMGWFISQNSKAEKWGTRRKLSECSQWILASYSSSNDRQENQCDATKYLCFLEHKSRLENDAQNVMRLRITKKHIPDESWKNHRLSCMASALQWSLSHHLSCWRRIRCYTSQWSSWTRKATEWKEKGPGLWERELLKSWKRVKDGKDEVVPSWTSWAFGLELPVPKSNPRACVKLKLCLPHPSQIHANHACRMCIKGNGAGDN